MFTYLSSFFPYLLKVKNLVLSNIIFVYEGIKLIKLLFFLRDDKQPKFEFYNVLVLISSAAYKI